MEIKMDPLEQFWQEVLSRDKDRVQAAINALDDNEERAAVVDHLKKMATEEGWSEPQRVSAQEALKALEL
jgi:NADH:ubiquinone oxidoreductase subunit E